MIFDKKTKIVATIGPASEKEEALEEIIMSGVNALRFNTKHNTIAWHNKKIKTAQKIADRLNKKIAILIDLQGPEIRLETKNQKEIKAEKGSYLTMGNDFSSSPDFIIANKAVFKCLKSGDNLLIDDGFIELQIAQKKKRFFVLEVKEGGIIRNKKSVNLPEKKLNLSSLIDHDLKSLDMIAKRKIDFIALSFVRNKKDILVLKKEMEHRKIEAMIVSKIENKEAIASLDEIIEYSDAIMIARGDLGIEVGIEELAYLQRKIIFKCRLARKPVIVATHMLYSMINNPRPTRAEATDIANAVFNRTDAVMLSEETALGNYPVRAVAFMSRILKFNEGKISFKKAKLKPVNSTELMIDAAVSMLQKKLFFDAVVIFTESGYTARVFSSYRQGINAIGITNNLKTAENLALSYGIAPYYVSFSLANPGAVKQVLEKLKREGIIMSNKIILVISGKLKARPDLVNSCSIIRT